MPIEYRVELRKTIENEVKMPIDLPTIFGDQPELADKAVYAQAASGSLAISAKALPPQPGATEAVQVVSVYRDDVRVFPRPRKTPKDKPVKQAQPAEDKADADARESA